MQRVCLQNRLRTRRGTTCVVTVIVAPVMFGFAALVVDVGYICAQCAETQNTADAGALAGASALREEEPDLVIGRALQTIALNQKTYARQSLDDQIIEIGTWDWATATFTALEGAVKGNAVHVDFYGSIPAPEAEVKLAGDMRKE